MSDVHIIGRFNHSSETKTIVYGSLEQLISEFEFLLVRGKRLESKGNKVNLVIENVNQLVESLNNASDNLFSFSDKHQSRQSFWKIK